MTSPSETNPSDSSQSNKLPETGLVRLSQILGDKKKGIPPIIPVSKSSWWAGVKSGRPETDKAGRKNDLLECY